MVFILKQDVAERIFKGKYRNVAAFTLGKKKGGVTSGDLEVEYAKLNFLPDEDTINAVVEGDMSAKKLCAAAVKALRNPGKDMYEVGIGMSQLINILTSPEKKGGPNILVFVEDEENPARNKVIVKYITALFETFGISPVTKEKVVKRLFKKRKTAPKRVAAFMNDKEYCRVSKKGLEIMRRNRIFFDIEMRVVGMTEMRPEDLSSKSVHNLIKTLLKMLSNQNLRLIDEMGLDKKETKKACKRLRKKNERIFDAYCVLNDILNSAYSNTNDMGNLLPKVKFGSDKKGKAKLNQKKFVKFFEKRRNRDLLMTVYLHIASVLIGLNPGESDYNKHMTNALSNVYESDKVKAFIASAKAYAKSTATA